MRTFEQIEFLSNFYQENNLSYIESSLENKLQVLKDNLGECITFYEGTQLSTKDLSFGELLNFEDELLLRAQQLDEYGNSCNSNR